MRQTIDLVLVAGILATVTVADPALATRSAFSPDQVWASRCGTCHTVGRGDDVGPDLQGITDRREPDWLISFIQSPTALIEAGDEIAVELFERFGRQKMPDHPYTPEQIEELLAWIEAGGPGDPVPPVRPASSASAEERRLGRLLFQGALPFAAGGAPCAHCHTLEETGGASLGGALTDVYDRYRDVELSHLLGGMASPLMREVYGPRPLTEEEVFCIKAFLADPGAWKDDGGPSAPERRGPWWLAVVSLAIVLVGGDGIRLLRRLRDRQPLGPEGDDRRGGNAP